MTHRPTPRGPAPQPCSQESTPITATETPAPAPAPAARPPYLRRTAIAIEFPPEPLDPADAPAILAALEDRIAAQFEAFLRNELAALPAGQRRLARPAADLAAAVEWTAADRPTAEAREQSLALGRRAIARAIAAIGADPAVSLDPGLPAG